MFAGRWPLVVVAAGGAVVLLAAVGGALSTSWQRPRLPADQAYDALPAAPPPPVGPAQPVRRDEIEVPVSGTVLGGTVFAPVRAGRYPAMVFVHGGGAGRRTALADQAEALAGTGIVTVVYDKRRVGYSFLHRDYGQLADDAAAVVRRVRQRDDVDPARVGLWGVSEGGWVVPIAASRTPEVAFAIVVAAPTMSPLRQVAWAVDHGLVRAGAPAGARRMAATAVGMGGPDYVHHDPVPTWERVDQPVLAVYGVRDAAVPPVESARILAAALDRGGNRSYTIRFFADADHGLKVRGSFAPGYLATIAAWVKGLPASGTPPAGYRVAGARPVQLHAASPPPAAPWYAGGAAVAAVFGLVTVGYLAGPVAALVRRRRCGGGAAPGGAWRPVRRQLRWLTVSGAATAVGVNVAIAVLVAVGLTGAPGLAAHAAWGGVRAAALLTAVLAAGSVVTVAAALRDGWRPDSVARVSVVGVWSSTALVLLLSAYWGLFAPGW